jgi:DNA-directed RNA polymerase specialized sigma24 family protein
MEAAAEALAWAWEHWDSVQSMANPLGYLYRVGQSRTRRRRARTHFARPPSGDVWVEPALPRALARLTQRQRIAVVLVHGFGWQLREVAEVTGLKVTTIQNHLERGLRRVRAELNIGGEND